MIKTFIIGFFGLIIILIVLNILGWIINALFDVDDELPNIVIGAKAILLFIILLIFLFAIGSLINKLLGVLL